MEDVRRTLASYLGAGNKCVAAWLHGLLAEIEAPANGPDAALAAIDRGRAIAEETGKHFSDSYLQRIRGDVLLKAGPENPAPAEEAFLTAITIAKQQGTRTFALRAALSLAKLYQSNGRPAEAHAILAPALDGFSPTPEFPEAAEALELMTTIEASAQL